MVVETYKTGNVEVRIHNDFCDANIAARMKAVENVVNDHYKGKKLEQIAWFPMCSNSSEAV